MFRLNFAWLKIKGTHPITNEVLHPDDLIRDFNLKRKIDTYVDDKIEVYKKDEVARKALMSLSSFSDALEDGHDEVADLYQKKIC